MATSHHFSHSVATPSDMFVVSNVSAPTCNVTVKSVQVLNAPINVNLTTPIYHPHTLPQQKLERRLAEKLASDIRAKTSRKDKQKRLNNIELSLSPKPPAMPYQVIVS